MFETALEGVTHLAHLAASVGVGQSMTNIVDYTRNNVMAAAVMLEVLSQKPHKVERIAVASSMSIYGEGDYVRPSTHGRVTADIRSHAQLEARRWEVMIDGEELEPVPTAEDKLLQPNSIYAVNKRDHEEMFLSVGRALQIPTVALRLFNAYGPQRSYWGTDITNGFAKATYRQRVTHFTETLKFLSESDKDWVMGRALLVRLKWA